MVIIFSVTGLYADAPTDPGGSPGSGDIPVGGGAPLAGGLVFLLIQGLLYTFTRINKMNKGFDR